MQVNYPALDETTGLVSYAVSGIPAEWHKLTNLWFVERGGIPVGFTGAIIGRIHQYQSADELITISIPLAHWHSLIPHVVASRLIGQSVTVETANRFGQYHYAGRCTVNLGARLGIYSQVERWRGSGQVQTWKRDPGRFSLPIKFGMDQSSRLDNTNGHLFHCADDCPYGLT
jgi:hypothetical protein